MAVINIDYAMTPTGFSAKRLADIIASMKARIQAVVDADTGESPVIDENDGSVISQILGISAEQISLCWQAAQAAASQFDPLYNTGAGMSGTVQLNGISRISGYPEQKTITLTGVTATVIPLGSIIATADGIWQFTTAEEVTLAGGTGTTEAICTVNGPTGLTTGDVNAILTPVAGWQGVVDTATPVIGKLEETDAELRIRQQRATAYIAKRHVEAIYDAVIEVEGVTYCRVYQNKTLETDVRGITAKSLAVVVVGGVDADVAEAIFSTSPIGPEYYGNLGAGVITLYDAQGEPYIIDFTRPEEIPIDIVVSVSQTDLSFPTTAAADIKAAILAYVSSGASAVGAGSNFDRNGFPPGETVVLSQLYTPINSVPGHTVTALTIAKHGEGAGTSDIDIAWNEAATFTSENITVNVA
jgi:uncharacterized phage protein gp47/JayE